MQFKTLTNVLTQSRRYQKHSALNFPFVCQNISGSLNSLYECIEKYQFELCSKYDREYSFEVILGKVVLCRKHSNDVARQVGTLSKRTIFVARCNFYVASVVTLYHDLKTSKCCNRCIFSLTTWEVLRHATSFFLHSSGILWNTYSMKTYVLLHFIRKNDVTFIIELHRATCLRLVALYKNLTMIVT